MCVRNACEGNVENQRFIESLKPQGVVVDATLEDKGLKVQFHADTGKFSVQAVSEEEMTHENSSPSSSNEN